LSKCNVIVNYSFDRASEDAIERLSDTLKRSKSLLLRNMIKYFSQNSEILRKISEEYENNE